MHKLLLLFLLVLSGCKSQKVNLISMPKDEYKWLKKVPENQEDLLAKAQKSEISLSINFETGDFKGKHNNLNFHGKYLIRKINSGFSKGFNYEITLEHFQNDVTQTKAEEKFMGILANATSFFVSPDKLYQPSYSKLSIKSSNDQESLIFIKTL